MTDQLEILRAEIVLGQECNAFFNTDPGRYVKARSNETVLDCIDKLKKVNPSDTKEVAKIQLELKSADNALSWLQDAINGGQSAMQQLQILANDEEN